MSVDLFEGLTDVKDEVAESTESVTDETVSTEDSGEDVETFEPQIFTDVPAGELPDGYVTVAAFAKEATKHLLTEGVDAFYVDYQSVSQAIKAKRDPFPYAIVRQVIPTPVKDEEGNAVNDADGNPTMEDVNNDTIVINLSDGLQAWTDRVKNPRPRGRGRKSITDESVTDRLLRIGKARAKLNAIEARKNKVLAALEKQNKLVAQYNTLLTRDGKTTDDADKAYDEWLASQDASKEIADDE